jgi:Ser/Thr protein kinase RdoA (MazF antagonist)
MDDDGEREARAALERMLGGAVAAHATLTTLGGGINRRSWLVVAGKQWVLQLPIPGAAGLLDVAAEAAVMGAAAAAGLAPPVAAVDAARGILLSEYRSGARPWSVADARVPRNVARAGALLRALHRVPVDVAPYQAERIAREYLTALAAVPAGPCRALHAREDGWAEELLGIARGYDAAHPPSVLCHNDLVAANVLDDGGLVLVDFEYAVHAAPVLDLAGLAGLNDYGERECRALLDAYYGDRHAEVSLAELARIVRMVRLVAFFWARLGAIRVARSAPYARLADELAQKLG